jgi:hypothetical protein
MEKIMSKSNDTSKLRIENVEAFTLDLGGANTFTVRQLRDDELQKVSGGITRSLPNGKTDVIKAMGNTKWGDIELKGG